MTLKMKKNRKLRPQDYDFYVVSNQQVVAETLIEAGIHFFAYPETLLLPINFSVRKLL